MFTLAHISDLHLPPLPRPGFAQLMSKRITGYLNWKLNRKQALDTTYLNCLIADLQAQFPDHTVITGDLVNLALPQEFSNAREFLDKFSSPERTTVMFGNHDAYVPGALGKAMQSWQEYACSDEYPLIAHKDFPVLRIRGEMALVGCNSAEATAPFMATGYFRHAQAQRLANILERTRDKCRIVCIHHSPIDNATSRHKRLVGAQRFREIIAIYGADLILHGHTHLAGCEAISGPCGPVPVISVPAAGNVHGNAKPAGSYNLFTCKKSGDKWKIEMQLRTCMSDGRSVETMMQRSLSGFLPG